MLAGFSSEFSFVKLNF